MESVEFIVPPLEISPLSSEDAGYYISGLSRPIDSSADHPWGGDCALEAAGEEVAVDPIIAAIWDSDWACRIVRGRLSGSFIPTDDRRRVVPRHVWEGLAEKIQAFYIQHAPPDSIERANRDSNAITFLPEAFWLSSGAETEDPGTVYVIRGGHGYYKIGKTENLADRLRALSTASPFDLEVILQFKVRRMGRLEQAIQQRFASRRVRGEWFELTDGDVSALQELHRLFRPPIPF